MFVGRQSGGDARWDASDAYSLAQNPTSGLIELVDLANPSDLVGSYPTTGAALAAMRP